MSSNKNSLKITDIKILFAEDNDDNFLLIETFLKELGINNYKGLKNGLELVKEYKTNKEYHVIILDIQMPIMDGIEALKKIRNIDSKIPVIALTAFALKEDERRYLKAGFTAYLPKPFKPSDLATVIEKIFFNSISE